MFKNLSFSHFNSFIKRTYLLFRFYLFSTQKRSEIFVYVSCAVIAGGFLLTALNLNNYELFEAQKNIKDYFKGLYPYLTTIFVLLITSSFFIPLHSSSRSQEWLLLPASVSNKFFSSLLFTLVASFVAITFLFLIVGVISTMLGFILYKRFYPLSWVVELNFLKAIKYVLQSFPLFFAGAIFFKRNHFVKTTLSAAAIGLISGIFFFSFVIKKILSSGEFSSVNDGSLQDQVIDLQSVLATNSWQTWFQVAWVFLSILLLIYVYFQIKKKQIN